MRKDPANAEDRSNHGYRQENEWKQRQPAARLRFFLRMVVVCPRTDMLASLPCQRLAGKMISLQC